MANANLHKWLQTYLPHTLHAYSGRGASGSEGLTGGGAGTAGRRFFTGGTESPDVVVDEFAGVRLLFRGSGFIKLLENKL